MNTQHYLIIACALVSASAVHALTLKVYNATSYTIVGKAGRVAASTVSTLILPQTVGTLELGAHTNDSVYALVSIPDATGKSFKTVETTRHYEAKGGQAYYTEFVCYGPVNGEFYMARPVF